VSTGARILKYRHERQQLRETGVETGKTNWFLQDNPAVPGQNAHHLLANLSNVQVVDQGYAEDDIDRGVR
jgi:hypothetical protein